MENGFVWVNFLEFGGIRQEVKGTDGQEARPDPGLFLCEKLDPLRVQASK